MLQEVIEKQGGYFHLDSPARTLSAKAHRPAYGSDGDYWSKPNPETVFDAVYEMMHEVDPSLLIQNSINHNGSQRYTKDFLRATSVTLRGEKEEIMATKVLVPRLGEGVDEVTVTKWLKQEGDTINELEPLLEVNTDKVDTEIPAPATGTVLKIIAQEGIAAKVGELAGDHR
jgi:biotin carboxyl carrier protein